MHKLCDLKVKASSERVPARILVVNSHRTILSLVVQALRVLFNVSLVVAAVGLKTEDYVGLIAARMGGNLDVIQL